MIKKLRLKIILILLFFGLPFFVSASPPQQLSFFISREFDLHQRREINALLIKSSPTLHFYIDQMWWEAQVLEEQNRIREALVLLDQEFRNNIYPRLTSIFGHEARPGIDGDERITILIHPMIGKVGGYFNQADGFFRIQAPNSNQREMVYLNALHIRREIMRAILAHEFIHLITFNQKDIIRRVSEEIWLNDVRAEFAATLLGYNNVFRGSSLENRTRIFLNNSTDSLTEWQEALADYGVVNLFAHYLVDHYGVRILVDSLHSNKVGIASINYALTKNGFQTDFSQIFTNFKIALLVNDCRVGEKFCFLNPHLRNFRITPRINFLPLVGEGVLQLVDRTTYWAGNWHRIVGGKRVLTLEFDGDDRVGFRIPYLLCDFRENCVINFLELDENQRGKFTIIGFNEKYASLTIMPSIQSRFSKFNGIENRYAFNWKASAVEKTEEEKEAELRKQLLEQITVLRAEITRLEAEIALRLETRRREQLALMGCREIETNLYFGMRDSALVRCLQEFLRAQDSIIYPEGLVTGNFFNATRRAVIRFQEKHRTEILAPIGLQRGTGFVGPSTRAKINKMIR